MTTTQTETNAPRFVVKSIYSNRSAMYQGMRYRVVDTTTGKIVANGYTRSIDAQAYADEQNEASK